MSTPETLWPGGPQFLQAAHFRLGTDSVLLADFVRPGGAKRGIDLGCGGGILGLLLESTHPGTLGALAVSGTNLSPQGLEPWFLDEFTALNRQAPNPLITLMLTEPHIPLEALHRIACPVLITAGEHDLILREETLRIASALPQAQLVIVEGADHGSYIQGSPVMGQLLLPFLEKLPD